MDGLKMRKRSTSDWKLTVRKNAAVASNSIKAASSGKGKKPGTGSQSTNTTWVTPGGLAAKKT